jgi:hypothetical protein
MFSAALVARWRKSPVNEKEEKVFGWIRLVWTREDEERRDENSSSRSLLLMKEKEANAGTGETYMCPLCTNARRAQ